MEYYLFGNFHSFMKKCTMLSILGTMLLYYKGFLPLNKYLKCCLLQTNNGLNICAIFQGNLNNDTWWNLPEAADYMEHHLITINH